jgi:hypothetical protein
MVERQLQTLDFSFFLSFFEMELAVLFETLLHIYQTAPRHVSSLKKSKHVIIFFDTFVGQR